TLVPGGCVAELQSFGAGRNIRAETPPRVRAELRRSAAGPSLPFREGEYVDHHASASRSRGQIDVRSLGMEADGKCFSRSGFTEGHGIRLGYFPHDQIRQGESLFTSRAEIFENSNGRFEERFHVPHGRVRAEVIRVF